MVTPIASYSFDESDGDILDRSGHGRDFALNNNLVRSATGHSNFGVSKSATGMPVVANPSFISGDGNWTIMFWQQGTAATGTWWLRLYNNADDTGSGLLNLGGLQVRVRKGGSNFASTPVAIPSDGLWHHYTISYDGAVGRLYIDSVLVGSTAVTASPLDDIDRIDMMEFSVLGESFVDDLRFFDIELSAEQIETYMNTPVVDDTTSGNAILIWSGTEWKATTRNIWNGSAWLET